VVFFLDRFKRFHKRKATTMLTAEAREKAIAARKAAPTRRQKMAAFADTFAGQRKEYPRTALPLIAQAERGSLPAAIALKCLDCSGWSKAEVRACVIPACPLFPHRPYQRLQRSNPNDPPRRRRDELATTAARQS
jgi:hypothetical protein